MPNLNSTIDLDVKKFFRWWLDELSFLVPETIRQLINEKRGYLIVRPAGEHLALSYAASVADELNSAGIADELLAVLERGATGIDQYQALQAKDERLAKANVILRLTAQEAIQKELSLPAAVKENLSQVVAYELDRYTPFTAEQVYFAVKPLEGENEPGQIRVMLVLTPREILQALYEDTKAMGLSLLFADSEAMPNDLEHGYDNYDLLPENLREKTATAPRLIYSALIAAIFFLLGTVMALPIWFEQQAVDSLEQAIGSIEKEARSVKVLQQEIDDMIDETRRLIEEKNSSPEIVEMLNTLSTIIKDDTWLNYLQYSDGHLQIRGESPAASTLIGILEDSALFTNVRFGSPVTQDKVTGLERFQVTADVIPPSQQTLTGEADD